MAIADLAPGQHATEVRNHWWWRPGWRVGRRFYALHITLEDQPDLHQLANEYRSALGNLDTVTLVPDRWLHMTMQGLGFTDEVPTETLNQVTEQVTEALTGLAPITVQFRDFVVGNEAIALPATPAAPIQQLRHIVRTAIGTVLGEDQVPEDPDRYRPHVSVAYLTAPGSSGPYVTALRKLNPQPVHVRINHVALIELHRDLKMYEWTSLAKIPIDGDPAA